MKAPVGTATVVSLLVATMLAGLASLVLAELPLPEALGLGVVFATLIVATASNELALYLLLFSMLLGPQLLVGDIGEGATLGRGLTLRLDDVLIAIVGLAWLAKSALYKELGLVFRTPLNLPIAAYTLAALLATGLGMMAGNVQGAGGLLFTLKYIQYFVIYFMVVNNLRDRRQFERFLIALLATAVIVSLIGILQIPTGVRVSAPFEGKGGEPNTFGGYLVLMLALVSGLFLTSQSRRMKLLLAALAVLFVVPLLFTLSRAAYLALIPMVAALLLWGERRWFITVSLAIGLVAAPLVIPAPVLDRVLYTFNEPPHREQVLIGGVQLDLSTSARIRSWTTVVFEDWPKRPLFGFGVTGYRFVDAQYPRVLAETGAAGLLAFLWLQVSLFRQARQVLRQTGDPLFRGVALGLLAGFVALVTHSIGANTFIIVRIMEPFWFLAGMVIMVPQLGVTPAVPEAAGRPAVASHPGSVPWRSP
ncbi:MAG: O-antigen ligase family protein [Candidatus Rokubacteria bacterium]|nr:O-antigen ligase family protein [Candidatus Rokubacteria bacterium]